MKKRGFTLVELLIVIAIIGILSTTVIVNFSIAKKKARDINRISSLRAIQRSLEGIMITDGCYPRVTGEGRHNWDYVPLDCTTNLGNFFHYDNASSAGFLNTNWIDPLGVLDDYESLYNCRYVVLKSEVDDNCIKHYLLHCYLEVSSYWSMNDGGCNDDIYELTSPEPFMFISPSLDLDS